MKGGGPTRHPGLNGSTLQSKQVLPQVMRSRALLEVGVPRTTRISTAGARINEFKILGEYEKIMDVIGRRGFGHVRCVLR